MCFMFNVVRTKYDKEEKTENHAGCIGHSTEVWNLEKEYAGTKVVIKIPKINQIMGGMLNCKALKLTT